MEEQMQAIVYRRYGSPQVLEVARVDRPIPGDDEVLVRIRAVGINPYDSHFLHGDPYLMRPMMGLGVRRPRRATILGSDVAGVVDAVGANVTRFRPGDEVYATAGMGGFAEFVAVREDLLALKPAGITFEQAAAVPMAALTALQALRDFGRLQPGQKVLVNGASGGVGSFAVQIAKALGAAEVTGVCSARNVELVRSLGADHVVDYTAEDFTRSYRKHDLLIDTVGNRSLRAFSRALTPRGTFVVVGGGGGRWLGPVAQILRAKLLSPFVSARVVTMMARSNGADLAYVTELIEAGKVRPVIDRTYRLLEAAEAIRHLDTRRVRGKVVLTV
jgi:NADPH:quinone reductase-like Zn-dependent oxidoreductase